MFRKGQRVKIADLTQFKDDGELGINPSMLGLSGRIVTLNYKDESYPHWRINEDGGAWSWHEDWFITVIKRRNLPEWW